MSRAQRAAIRGAAWSALTVATLGAGLVLAIVGDRVRQWRNEMRWTR